jgi:ABC-type phosphate transport system ATPase subunit
MYLSDVYMKCKILLPAILAILCSCGKLSLCKPENHTFTFATSKVLDTVRIQSADTSFTYYSITTGHGANTVFRYLYSFQDCPNIADDEGTRTVLFEVPDGVNSFSFEDSAGLRRAKAMVFYSCECYPSGIVGLKSGFIKGEKKDGKWVVKASLKLRPQDSRTIIIDNIFKQE